jgi:hypothetical protein
MLLSVAQSRGVAAEMQEGCWLDSPANGIFRRSASQLRGAALGWPDVERQLGWPDVERQLGWTDVERQLGGVLRGRSGAIDL